MDIELCFPGRAGVPPAVLGILPETSELAARPVTAECLGQDAQGGGRDARPTRENTLPADTPASSRQRLRLTISYDGRPFQGWQSQAHRDTIQDRIEKAFCSLCAGERISVHGSGRTDAGVHALGQIAHADVPASIRHSPERWILALNAHLPPEIRVRVVRRVSTNFHARFTAQGKIYRYRIWNAPVLPPLEYGRAWHFPQPLDLERMTQAAALLAGRHDFAGFAARRARPGEDTVRILYDVSIRRQGALITLHFHGSGFLYKMVRLMTGTLVRCAQHRAELDWIERLLQEPAGAVKTSFAAPADGLYLVRVLYRRVVNQR
jgi:tRNA pseudouridine38-40 synthase